MNRLRVYTLSSVALAALVGCYDPTIGSGELGCSESNAECPDGFHCAYDTTCWKDGTDPVRGPPSAPVAIAAIPQLHGAQVTWFPPYNDGGSPVTGYTVVASPGGATVNAGPTSPLVASFDSLADGTSYTFTVTAENALGAGSASQPSAAIQTPGLPGAVTNVVATVPGAGTVNLTWTAAPANGAAITSYAVTANPPDSSATVDTTSATLFFLKHGTPYTFTITATNVVGTGPATQVTTPVTP